MSPITQLIYLDNNATTPLHPKVLEAITECLKHHFGNPASSTHTMGWYSQELVTIARERVARAMAATPQEIYFTSGATESNNLALKGVVAHRVRKRGVAHVISAATEHPAVLEPLNYLAGSGTQVTILPVGVDGSIDFEQLANSITAETVMISLMAANNEVGTLHELKRIGELARSRGVLFHCDGTQALGKLPLNVSECKIDLLSISAHKLYGPKGVGALFVRKEVRSEIDPLFHGGGHERGMRAGTVNVAGIVGFGVAAEEVVNKQATDDDSISRHAERLYLGLRNELGDLPVNGRPIGSVGRLPGNLNFQIPGIESAALVGILATKLAFSTSSACSSAEADGSHVLRSLGLSHQEVMSSIRLGVGRFNTADEIEQAIDLLAAAVKKLRG